MVDSEDNYEIDKFIKMGTTDCRTDTEIFEPDDDFLNAVHKNLNLNNESKRNRARSSIHWINDEIENSDSNLSLSSINKYLNRHLRPIDPKKVRNTQIREIITFLVGFGILVTALCLFISITINVSTTLHPYQRPFVEAVRKPANPAEGFVKDKDLFEAGFVDGPLKYIDAIDLSNEFSEKSFRENQRYLENFYWKSSVINHDDILDLEKFHGTPKVQQRFEKDE